MSDKAYEDVTDDDVRALAEERRKHREGDRTKLPPGLYRTRVKAQKPLLEVPQSGIFAGQVHTLLTHAVLNKDGDEVLGSVFFNRLALPLTAPGMASSQKGRSIALSNVCKLRGESDPENYEESTAAAIADAKASARGEAPFVDRECFLRVEANPYVDKNTGEQKMGQRVFVAEFLRKGEELSPLPGQDSSDKLEACCDD
jgi:hypothetical protein